MPCSAMRAGIVIREEVDTALTLRDLTFTRGMTCVFITVVFWAVMENSRVVSLQAFPWIQAQTQHLL